MKFTIGDRVLLKRTGEEGFLIAFLAKGMMEVDVNGVRFPVHEDEVDHPYLKWFTEPKKPKAIKRVKEVPEDEKPAGLRRLSRGIYLSFFPQFAQGITDDIIEAFSIHLLNETAGHLVFSYHTRTSAGGTILQLNGSLHPFANIFLHSLTLEELNEQPRFYWHVAPKDKPEAGVENMLRIRTAQLVRYISTLLQDGEPSFTILLTQDGKAIPDAAREAEKSIALKPQSDLESRFDLHTEAVAVLDLHVEADNGSDGNILSMQLRLLEQKLNAAFAAGQDSMLVIHGIGSGALRDAVHEVLRQTPFVKRYSNHWMAAYGWGATEVFFRND